jgi:hypothetical protein
MPLWFHSYFSQLILISFSTSFIRDLPLPFRPGVPPEVPAQKGGFLSRLFTVGLTVAGIRAV